MHIHTKHIPVAGHNRVSFKTKMALYRKIRFKLMYVCYVFEQCGVELGTKVLAVFAQESHAL